MILAAMQQFLDPLGETLPCIKRAIDLLRNFVRIFAVEPLAKSIVLGGFDACIRVFQSENELNKIVGQVGEFMPHQQSVLHLFEDFCAFSGGIENARHTVGCMEFADYVEHLQQLVVNKVKRASKCALGSGNLPRSTRLLVAPVQRGWHACGHKNGQYSSNSLDPVRWAVLTGSRTWSLTATGQCPRHHDAGNERHNCDNGPISVGSSLLHAFPPLIGRILPLGVVA